MNFLAPSAALIKLDPHGPPPSKSYLLGMRLRADNIPRGRLVAPARHSELSLHTGRLRASQLLDLLNLLNQLNHSLTHFKSLSGPHLRLGRMLEGIERIAHPSKI